MFLLISLILIFLKLILNFHNIQKNILFITVYNNYKLYRLNYKFVVYKKYYFKKIRYIYEKFLNLYL